MHFYSHSSPSGYDCTGGQFGNSAAIDSTTTKSLLFDYASLTTDQSEDVELMSQLVHESHPAQLDESCQSEPNNSPLSGTSPEIIHTPSPGHYSAEHRSLEHSPTDNEADLLSSTVGESLDDGSSPLFEGEHFRSATSSQEPLLAEEQDEPHHYSHKYLHHHHSAMPNAITSSLLVMSDVQDNCIST